MYPAFRFAVDVRGEPICEGPKGQAKKQPRLQAAANNARRGRQNPCLKPAPTHRCLVRR